jgi:hypothetical protein
MMGLLDNARAAEALKKKNGLGHKQVAVKNTTDEPREHRTKPGFTPAARDIVAPSREPGEDPVEPEHMQGTVSVEQKPEPFPLVNAADLDKQPTDIEYACEFLLVKGQPGIIAAAKKTLKTNIAIDLTLSLSHGIRFLQVFSCPRPLRTAFFSGETGPETIIETARRIAMSKGYLFRGFTNAWFSFRVPNLARRDHLKRIEQQIVELKLEVIIIDPVYLALPLKDNAANLFEVGELLRSLAEIAQKHRVTLVLVHHTKKGVADQFAPSELEDIAWAGFAEFARQWMLISRREKYDAEHGGSHKLWFNVGGSAGHSGLWALDIEEGVRQDPSGRRWDVSVRPASEARAEAAEAGQAEKEQRRLTQREAELETDKTTIVGEMKGLKGPDTKTGIRDDSKVPPVRFNRAWSKLIEEKTVVSFGTVRKGNNQPLDGYCLATQADGFRNRQQSSAVVTMRADGCVVQQSSDPPIGGLTATPLIAPSNTDDLNEEKLTGAGEPCGCQ